MDKKLFFYCKYYFYITYLINKYNNRRKRSRTYFNTLIPYFTAFLIQALLDMIDMIIFCYTRTHTTSQ